MVFMKMLPVKTTQLEKEIVFLVSLVMKEFQELLYLTIL